MWQKLVLAMVLLTGLWTAVSAQEPNRAALVVSLEDGETAIRCVEFEEDEISGYELLARSGLGVETSAAAMGAAVCGLADTGCPADDCFCACKGGGDCVYWSYWHLNEGEWQYAQAGAGLYQVGNGAVDGWTWGPGSVQDAIEPPPLTFDEVCRAAENDAAPLQDEPPNEGTEPTPPSNFIMVGVGRIGVIGSAVLILGILVWFYLSRSGRKS